MTFLWILPKLSVVVLPGYEGVSGSNSWRHVWFDRDVLLIPGGRRHRYNDQHAA